VDIFLRKGMIDVRTAKAFDLTKPQLKELLNDIGVTFRMGRHPSP